MCGEYRKHSSGPDVNYLTACECRKWVSVPEEVFYEPIILYYECNITDNVPRCFVALSISIPINREAFQFTGKRYMNCHEVVGTGGSNSRDVNRARVEQKGKVKLGCIFETAAAR